MAGRATRWIGRAAILSLVLGGALAVTPPAAAGTKQVQITSSLLFITQQDGPYKCTARVFVQFEQWDTEIGWEIHYSRNGAPRVVTAWPGHPALDADYASPPAGQHWFHLAVSSKDFSGPREPANCADLSNNQKGVYTDPEVYATVDEDDPGPGEDPPPPEPPEPEPPVKEELTPTVVDPPPVKWPFDPKRPTITLVDCEADAEAAEALQCTAAAWDARPDDPGASAPTGTVVWFAPTGTLAQMQCTLVETTGPVSTCVVGYDPSAETAGKAKQPVEGGYQGSGVHRPSSGLDGMRPVPVPVTWRPKAGKVKVGLFCGGDKPCVGTAVVKARKGKRFATVGRTSYRIPAGQTAMVKVGFTKAGKALVGKTRKQVRGKLVVAPRGGQGMRDVHGVKV